MKHFSPYWLYFPAFVVVIIGLIVYFWHATRELMKLVRLWESAHNFQRRSRGNRIRRGQITSAALNKSKRFKGVFREVLVLYREPEMTRTTAHVVYKCRSTVQ